MFFKEKKKRESAGDGATAQQRLVKEPTVDPRLRDISPGHRRCGGPDPVPGLMLSTLSSFTLPAGATVPKSVGVPRVCYSRVGVNSV